MIKQFVLKQLGLIIITLTILGCGTSYVEVKPTVAPIQNKSTYSVATSSKKNTIELNPEELSSVAIIDLKVVEENHGSTIIAYVDTNKKITFRYLNNSKFNINLDGKTLEGNEIKLNTYITGKNVFDANKNFFVYVASKNEAIVAPFSLSNITKLASKNLQNDFYRIRSNAPIKQVLLLPKNDLQEIVVVTEDNQISLWQLNTNKQAKLNKILIKHDNEIIFAKMSKSGKYLAYSDKNKLKIFNIYDSKVSASFNVDQITSMDFSPNEQRIAVASKSKYIKEYDIEKGLEVGEFMHDHFNTVNGLEYDSFDKNIITTAGDDGRLRTWEWAGNKANPMTFNSYIDNWNSLVDLSGSGKRFHNYFSFTLTVNQNPVFFNPASGRNHCTMDYFANKFYDERFEQPFYKQYSPNITRCSILGTKEQIIDYANKDVLEQLVNIYVDAMIRPKNEYTQINSKIVSQARNFFLALNGGQYFGLTKINGEIYAYGTGYKDAVFSYIEKAHPKFGEFKLTNNGVSTEYQAYPCKECTVEFDSLRFSHDNRIEKFNIYNIHKFGSGKDWHDSYESIELINKTKFSIVKKNTVEIWDIQDVPKLENIIQENGEIYAIAYDKTKNLLAIGSSSKVIKIWDLNTMSLVGQLSGHTENVISLKFLHNGTKLISAGGDDKTIKIWDINTMTNIKSIQNDGRTVSQIFILPDEKQFLFVNHQDGMVSNSKIRIYDASTYSEINTISPQIGYIKAIKYLQDSNQILAISSGEAFGSVKTHLFSKINLKTSEQQKYQFHPNFQFTKNFIIDKEKNIIVVVGNSAILEVLDLNTLAKIRTIDFGLDEKGKYDTLTSLAYTEDKKLIAGSKVSGINMLTRIPK
ncbi:Vegetative incompatibility protein HET-E-1 [Sulfurospirillum sp. 'SP']|nr:WD40 repeat domain-containing protein [Sulfurospirillum sp. 'SP']WNY97957.1 Vegetative incompatibility protein HET-E-1 [Sulfurospirillum sp. 'SP']